MDKGLFLWETNCFCFTFSVFTHSERSLSESDFILVNMTVIFFRTGSSFIKCIVQAQNGRDRVIFSEQYINVDNYQIQISPSRRKTTRFDGFLHFQETYFGERMLEEGLHKQGIRAKCIALYINCDGFISTTLDLYSDHSQGLRGGISSCQI